MGTNVYTVDVDNPQFDIKTDVKSHSCTRFSIWIDEGKVTISESQYLTGINHKTADRKRWWRWRSMAAYGFMRTKTGLAQPFEVKRTRPERGNGWTNVVPVRAVNYLGGSDEIGNAYKAQMAKAFGFTEFSELYPMAADFNITKFSGMPIGIRNAFRQDDLLGFTTAIFGVKRINDDLLASVAKADPYFIALAHQYRGLVPDQMLVNFLNTQRISEEVEKEMDVYGQYGVGGALSPRIRPILRKVNKESAANLIAEEIDKDNFMRLSYLASAVAARGKKLTIDGSFEFKNYKALYSSLAW